MPKREEEREREREREIEGGGPECLAQLQYVFGVNESCCHIK